AMESTVVATAMPTVVRSLGGIQIYSWVFSGFLLTQTVTMPLWGRFSDLYGRRPVFLIGLATFLGGSALSGTAQSMAQLIVFRMVQGLGGGARRVLVGRRRAEPARARPDRARAVRGGGAPGGRADRAAPALRQPHGHRRRRHPLPRGHGDVRRDLVRPALPPVGHGHHGDG